MASDTIYKDLEHGSPRSSPLTSSEQHLATSEPNATTTGPETASAANTAGSVLQNGMIVLGKKELLEYEEKVFLLISENSGKFTFTDLLQVVGGPVHKNILYKALASLAKQARIERIRGIGKKRIEFYYYDSKKIKRPTPSASVNFVSH